MLRDQCVPGGAIDVDAVVDATAGLGLKVAAWHDTVRVLAGPNRAQRNSRELSA